MQIQWYPGHMAKAERKIREETSKADVMIIVGDARAPEKSVNADFYKSIGSKRRITVYNKMSLADPAGIEKWRAYYRERGDDVFFTDCVSREGISQVTAYLKALKKTFKFEREARAIVAGIPNVGKSLLINTLCRKGSAKTGDIPGVTRGTNWIRSDEFYLLDTPGVLPPKFVEPEDGVILASIGCVKDTILDREDLALEIIDFMSRNYPLLLSERYRIDIGGMSPLQIYEAIASKRGFILKGGEYDYERCASTVIDEFRAGTIGRVMMCMPGVERC